MRRKLILVLAWALPILAADVAFTPYSTVNTGSCLTGNFALGADGATYFTNAYGCPFIPRNPPGSNRLGRISVAGNLDYLPVGDNVYPAYFTAAPDGNVWFTADQVADYTSNSAPPRDTILLGTIQPDGTITTNSVQTMDYHGDPFMGPIVVGPGGYLWFVWGDVNDDLHLGRVDAITRAVTDFPLAGYKNYGQMCMTMGPDGNLWFTGFDTDANNLVVRIDFAAHTYTPGTTEQFLAAPYSSLSYTGIAAGPDGAIWIDSGPGSYTDRTQWGTTQVQRIMPDGSVIANYTLQDVAAIPFGGNQVIAPGPDGNMWVSERTKIASISMSGEINEYNVPSVVYPPVEVQNCGIGSIDALTGGMGIGRVTPTSVQLWVSLIGTYNCNSPLPPDMNSVVRVNISASPQQRMRPMPMGVSVSNTPVAKYGTGTAGLVVVRSGATSPRFVLSNSHVLGSMGSPGCPGSAVAGQALTIQPGAADLQADPGNDSTYVVGKFAHAWAMGPVSLIDAAVSVLMPDAASIDILGIGTPAATIGTAAVRESVIKSGRSTGVTVGTVVADNCSVNIPYPNDCGTVRFTDQIAIRATSSFFSLGGDSGAAVLDAQTHEPVGLVFAGNGFLTYANKMTNVEQLLGVVPVGGSSSSDVKAPRLAQAPAMERLKAIQARHEDDVLKLPGVQAIGIESHDGGFSFVVFGSRWTIELAHTMPPELEGVPVRFEATGAEMKPLTY